MKYFILGLLIFVILVAIAIVMKEKLSPDQQKSVAATVNGESIYHEDLEMQYNRIPEQVRATFTKEDLLNQLVERKILMQKAMQAKTEVAETEVDKMIDTIRAQLPEGKSLENILAEEKIAMSEIRGEIKEQLLISNFLEQKVLTGINVTENELESYLNDTFGGIELSNDTVFQVQKYLLVLKQKEAYDRYMNATKVDAEIQLYKPGEKFSGSGFRMAKPDTKSGPSLAECLAGKEVVLYGSDECDFTKKQLEILGSDIQKIKIVDCTGADGKMTKECVDAGISVYPTWKISGKFFNGTRTLDQLKDISGC